MFSNTWHPLPIEIALNFGERKFQPVRGRSLRTSEWLSDKHKAKF